MFYAFGWLLDRQRIIRKLADQSVVQLRRHHCYAGHFVFDHPAHWLVLPNGCRNRLLICPL
jgi:hypothetical protein